VGTEVILGLWAGSGALIGALITPLIYWAKGRKPASGFFAGVLAGGLGNLLFLLPLWIFLRRRLPDTLRDQMTAYNMGVGAVIGGRYEEARWYFMRVATANPAHIGAWLNLAYLATTPLEAWSYVERARAVNPAHPQVQQAVAILWSQVQSHYAAQTPDRSL
jgi:Flp pilus assembly protein TadD